MALRGGAEVGVAPLGLWEAACFLEEDVLPLAVFFLTVFGFSHWVVCVVVLIYMEVVCETVNGSWALAYLFHLHDCITQLDKNRKLTRKNRNGAV